MVFGFYVIWIRYHVWDTYLHQPCLPNSNYFNFLVLCFKYYFLYMCALCLQFSVFTSHVIKMKKNRNHSIKRSIVWETIDDWYINNLAKIQVSAVFHPRVICRSVSPKFIELRMETLCLCPTRVPTHWKKCFFYRKPCSVSKNVSGNASFELRVAIFMSRNVKAWKFKRALLQ